MSKFNSMSAAAVLAMSMSGLVACESGRSSGEASSASMQAAGADDQIAAAGEAMRMGTTLSGQREVPPNDSPGRGSAEVMYDDATNELSWSIASENTTGPITAAHFHGPAAPGQNAGVQVPIPLEPSGNSMQGSATLTDAQEDMLKDGNMYINLHTEQFPNGELRGQVRAM